MSGNILLSKLLRFEIKKLIFNNIHAKPQVRPQHDISLFS